VEVSEVSTGATNLKAENKRGTCRSNQLQSQVLEHAVAKASAVRKNPPVSLIDDSHLHDDRKPPSPAHESMKRVKRVYATKRKTGGLNNTTRPKQSPAAPLPDTTNKEIICKTTPKEQISTKSRDIGANVFRQPVKPVNKKKTTGKEFVDAESVGKTRQRKDIDIAKRPESVLLQTPLTNKRPSKPTNTAAFLVRRECGRQDMKLINGKQNAETENIVYQLRKEVRLAPPAPAQPQRRPKRQMSLGPVLKFDGTD
jgi:hypothetical protein